MGTIMTKVIIRIARRNTGMEGRRYMRRREGRRLASQGTRCSTSRIDTTPNTAMMAISTKFIWSSLLKISPALFLMVSGMLDGICQVSFALQRQSHRRITRRGHPPEPLVRFHQPEGFQQIEIFEDLHGGQGQQFREDPATQAAMDEKGVEDHQQPCLLYTSDA